MKNGNTIQNAIIYSNYLNVTDISFHYSIAGSVLLLDKESNDIDIVAAHATPDKSGKVDWIVNNLKEVGFTLSGGFQTGIHNRNFYVTKRDITLHIIVMD